MMRVVIDMQGAQTESRRRGIGRYTLAFVQAVVQQRNDHEFVLALNGMFPETVEPIRAAFEGILPQKNIRVWYAVGPVREQDSGNGLRRRMAEVTREAFLVSLNPDVIHVTSVFEGYVDDAIVSNGRFDRKTPVTASLYDLIPANNPEEYLEPDSRFAEFYRRQLTCLQSCSMYLAISEFCCLEGIDTLNRPESDFVNVSGAVEEVFNPVSISSQTAKRLREKLRVTRGIVLYTGGSDPRKNLPRLVHAFAQLPMQLRESHQLLLVGNIPDDDRKVIHSLVRSTGMESDAVRFAGYVTDRELVQLYNLCALYVFPSWHEGLGLPALEAMSCGAPVIAANKTSLPEVIGNDTALFDPFDIGAITAKMADVLDNHELRESLQRHGIEQAARFSWRVSADKACRAWESLVERAQTSDEASEPRHPPQLAIVSPLPPERTGIADYTAELIPALAQHYEIVMVTAQAKVEGLDESAQTTVRGVDWLRKHGDSVDRVLYHVGNSHFHAHMLPLIREIPGTVVLHDFFLSGLLSWSEQSGDSRSSWTEALYRSHGYRAVEERYREPESARATYPCSFDVIANAQGVIVHSGYSRAQITQWYGAEYAERAVVIPLLRARARNLDREAAREKLGLAHSEFVVCVFGFVDPSKLNHVLLQAWLDSGLSGNDECHLIFVGENHGGQYGEDLRSMIRSAGIEDRVRITGFASPEVFRSYLQAADMAVQLRTQSRGETSGTILDCLNYGVPVIVNANGAAAELDNDAVWMLADRFDHAGLVDALETLWNDAGIREELSRRGRKLIAERHTPKECAQRYAEAIERFHREGMHGFNGLIDALACEMITDAGKVDLVTLSKEMAATFPAPRHCRELLVDITATCRNDRKTGIERVASSLISALLDAPPDGFRIEPVYLCNSGDWHYRYARGYMLERLGCPPESLADERVDPDTGDILLGVDISGDAAIGASAEGVFDALRNSGVFVYWLLFDLLPIRIPGVFPPGADKDFENWLYAISGSDGVIAISRTTADDYARWRQQSYRDAEHTGRRSFSILWNHLGADVAGSFPSYGMPQQGEEVLQTLASNLTFLMVGTVEPRKAHWQVLEAFELLWEKGLEVKLVVVGNEGWEELPDGMRRGIPDLVRKLRNHAERGNHLRWLTGVSDEYLNKLYGAGSCLIAASYGEGYGLPLIEAAQHELPLLIRDIPVFREVAGDHAYYFTGNQPSELAAGIEEWLVLYNRNEHPRPRHMPRLCWRESAERLKELLLANVDRQPAVDSGGLAIADNVRVSD